MIGTNIQGQTGSRNIARPLGQSRENGMFIEDLNIGGNYIRWRASRVFARIVVYADDYGFVAIGKRVNNCVLIKVSVPYWPDEKIKGMRLYRTGYA